MAFHVGQKVVCVDDKFRRGDWIRATPHRPLKGQSYTIRSIHAGLEGDALLLEEICNPLSYWRGFGKLEPGFYAIRFRPIAELKTDTGMAILKKIAAGASKKLVTIN